MIDVAIVGAGPAGSSCARSLAESGRHAVLFDSSHPREKPCGGLVSPKAQQLFPFLKELPIEHCERKEGYFVSPCGKRACVSSSRSGVRCFSRLDLDRYLLERALDKGAELITEKVLGLEKRQDTWKIIVSGRSYSARILIGADGVNSLVREFIVGPLDSWHKGFCFGYLVKGLESEEITIWFLSHRKGYMWVAPRKDHTCVGIGTAELLRSNGLKRELDLFIEKTYPHAEIISQWASLIPNVKDLKVFLTPLTGANWIIIGDAAGHVDPMIGEGIPYALWDGELAAEAIVQNNLPLFDELWRKAYGWDLFRKIKLRSWLYRKPSLELYCTLLRFGNRLFL